MDVVLFSFMTVMEDVKVEIKKPVIVFFEALLISLGALIILAWVNQYPGADWCYVISYFMLTCLALEKLGKRTASYQPYIILGLFLGRIILEIPIRIVDFWPTLSSLNYPIISILAILAAWWYYRERSSWLLIGILAIFILINTIGTEWWMSFVMNYR